MLTSLLCPLPQSKEYLGTSALVPQQEANCHNLSLPSICRKTLALWRRNQRPLSSLPFVWAASVGSSQALVLPEWLPISLSRVSSPSEIEQFSHFLPCPLPQVTLPTAIYLLCPGLTLAFSCRWHSWFCNTWNQGKAFLWKGVEWQGLPRLAVRLGDWGDGVHLAATLTNDNTMMKGHGDYGRKKEHILSQAGFANR